MNQSARRPIVAGNWKLNKNIEESLKLVTDLKNGLPKESKCEIVIAPVFTALHPVNAAIEGTPIKLSAQDVYWEDQGAFTGEVSVPLLRDVGCEFVIVGHSERRQFFGETDQSVNKKAKAVLGHQMMPIICVGESLQEREQGTTLEVIISQVKGALEGFTPTEMKLVVVAYEPIWAIGTGRTASPQDAQEAHAAIRKQISAQFGQSTADATRVLYGGSVKPANTASLMAQPDVDGALVGGASLTAESFIGIIEAAG